MKCFGLPLLTVIFIVGQAMADDPPGGDLPPEVKAQIKLHTTMLRDSKKSAERAKAAEALGALGASGMTARRNLCQAMMDSAPSVRIAAVDALKKIDEPTYKLATAIFINRDVSAILQARAQGVGAEPLTPLILKMASGALNSITALSPNLTAPPTDRDNPTAQQMVSADRLYRDCISTLSEICKSDSTANKLIIGCLTYQIQVSRSANASTRNEWNSSSAGTRQLAIQSIRKMANVKQALKPLLYIASADSSGNRIAAIEVLTEIADTDNKAAIKKTFEAHRFDNDASIRQAIDAALSKLEGK